jgi:MraZ protein
MAPMFRGQFLHTIDSKGRVSLPSRFRDAIAADASPCLVITPAPFEPCLHVYPLREWELFENKISEFSNWDIDVVRFRRLYVSAAIECEVDRTGRVLVPQHLREKTELEKDVLWAGMGRISEMWSKARWDEALSMTNEQQAAFRRAVMETIRI